MARPLGSDTPQDWFWCRKCRGITQHRGNLRPEGRIWRCRWCKSWNTNAQTLEEHIEVSALLDV